MGIESVIGPVPDGWEITTLGEVCKRGGGHIQTGPFGSQLHASDYVAIGVPFIMPVNIGDNRIIAQDIARISEQDTEYIVLRPKPPLPEEFAYFLARTEEFRSLAISNMTGTSGRQRVPADSLKHFRFVVPDPEIAEHFGHFARLALEKMKCNDDQSRTLAAIRDALLPKLLSGEISTQKAQEAQRAQT